MEKYGNNQNKADRPPDQIFRVAKGWRIFSVVATILLCVMWIASVPVLSINWGFILFLNAFYAGFTLLSFYNSVSAFKDRIEIYPDRIKNISIFRTSELLISETSGFRMSPYETLVLLPKDTKVRKIKVGFSCIERKSDLWEWLNQNLVYLDIEDFEIEIKRIQQNRWPDKSGDYMQWKLNSAQKWSRILNISGLILTLWTIFYPRPYKYTIWVLIIFPLVVLGFIHHFGGLLKIGDNRKIRLASGRFRFMFSSIGHALVFPCIGLTLPAICCWNILCWNKIFWPVASFSACFCFLLFSVNRGLKWKAGTVTACIFISLFYGCPSAIILNMILDTSTPSIYKTTVINKYICKKDCFLTLSPWITEANERSVQVRKSAYYKYEPGDTIEVTVKDGCFGIPWVTVD